jgi:type VI secretion system Hcp family effector
MTETPNHGYNTPEKGTQNWHEPLNENFEQHDTDIEIRDQVGALNEYEPKNNAKFLATDTGNVFIGDGEQWNLLDTTASPNPSGFPTTFPAQNVHGYAEMRDSGGNLIKGSNDRFDDGRGEWVEVLQFDHSINNEVDPQTGDLRGIRQHQPFTFMKPFDPATPLLAQTLTNGETLQEVKLHWHDGEGTEFFTHTLSNVKISGIESGNSEIRTFGSMPREEITMVYETITWTITDGNIGVSDPWTGSENV